MTNWTLPDVVLPASTRADAGVDDLSDVLTRALRELGAPSVIERVLTGPTTIRWELRPGDGVRCRDYTRLGRRDDLARALSAQTIRVLAPIPGRSLVGVEIPAPEAQRRVVGLREVVPYTKPPLRAALGLEPSGRVVALDIASLPHLGIAGASGSGKTSLIHAMLCSLLMRCTPDDLALLLIDPKGGTEFGRYEGLPHLYGEPLVSAASAIDALRWLAEEVRARYTLLRRHGCRTLEEYNVDKEAPEGNVPRALCVVDELADLMLSAKEQVESVVVRLGQLGRACGVHLVLATQSPHATVFSGLIKANMVGRVCLKVVSGTHSRVAIDQSGAESLLGRGDALLQDGTSTDLLRFQSAFVEDSTLQEIVRCWTEQAEGVERVEQVKRVEEVVCA